jgi:hypothetical protein
MRKILIKAFLFIGLFAMAFVFNSSSINAARTVQTETSKEDNSLSSKRLGVHWKGLGGCRFKGKGCTVTVCSGGSYCFRYW